MYMYWTSLFYKFPMSDYVMNSVGEDCSVVGLYTILKSRIKPVHVTIILLANPKSPIITNKILKAKLFESVLLLA